MGRLINMIGKKYGHLIVLERSGMDRHNKNILWLCQCDCGKKAILPGTSLRTGNTKTCGCSRKYTKSKSNRWLGYEEISQCFFNDIKASAKKRNIVFDITIEQIWQLFLEQDKKCALTGEEIYFPESSAIRGTASLDRIDSKKGYTIDNIQWVHKKINIMKQTMDNVEFVNTCKMVVKYKG